MGLRPLGDGVSIPVNGSILPPIAAPRAVPIQTKSNRAGNVRLVFNGVNIFLLN